MVGERTWTSCAKARQPSCPGTASRDCRFVLDVPGVHANAEQFGCRPCKSLDVLRSSQAVGVLIRNTKVFTSLCLAVSLSANDHAELCNKLLQHYHGQCLDRTVYWTARERAILERDLLCIADSFDIPKNRESMGARRQMGRPFPSEASLQR